MREDGEHFSWQPRPKSHQAAWGTKVDGMNSRKMPALTGLKILV